MATVLLSIQMRRPRLFEREVSGMSQLQNTTTRTVKFIRKLTGLVCRNSRGVHAITDASDDSTHAGLCQQDIACEYSHLDNDTDDYDSSTQHNRPASSKPITKDKTEYCATKTTCEER